MEEMVIWSRLSPGRRGKCGEQDVDDALVVDVDIPLIIVHVSLRYRAYFRRLTRGLYTPSVCTQVNDYLISAAVSTPIRLGLIVASNYARY